MEVTFTKEQGHRYVMTVVRERGPQLAPRGGPGYDDHLPHDAVHFIVEAEAGIDQGVFGRIAAGESNLFWLVDPAQRRHQARREARRPKTAARTQQMERSEALASACQVLWRLRSGGTAEAPAWFSRVDPDLLTAPLTQRILARLDAFARDWQTLPAGEGITLSWPGPRRGHTAGRKGQLRRSRVTSTA